MGTMQATCYHNVDVSWITSGDGTITIKDFARDGSRTTSYRVVCPACKVWYEKEKLILHTEQEKTKWLRRGKNAKKQSKSKSLSRM